MAGVVFLYLTFDWALIGLSSVVGSSLIVQSLNLTGQLERIVYALLIAVGIAFQAALFISRKHDPK